MTSVNVNPEVVRREGENLESMFLSNPRELKVPEVRGYMGEFVDILKTGKAFPYGNIKQPIVFGNTNLSHWFSIKVDPLLAKLIRRVQFFEQSLAGAGLITYPLKNQLLASCLTNYSKTAALSSELLSEYSDNEYKLERSYHPAILADNELLYTVAYICTAINNIRKAPVEHFTYCSVCYRTKASSLKYCSEHSSTPSNDHAYNHAKKVYDLLSESVKQQWEKHASLRRAMNEEPAIYGKEIAYSLRLGMGPLTLGEHERDQMRGHQQNPDSSVPYLLGLIEQLDYLKPQFASLLTAKSHSWSWQHLCTEVMSCLNNRSEKTLNPFWVTEILIMANHWAFTEGLVNHGIKRKDIDMANSLLAGNSIPELAKQHGVSRQTVYNRMERLRQAGLPV